MSVGKRRIEIGNSHRGRFDIIADILEASSNGGTRKTYLLYRCNLSFRQLKYYMDFLVRRKLLCVVKDRGSNPGMIEVTVKGKKFLEAYEGLKALMH